MTTRSVVFEAICEERDYQDVICDELGYDRVHPVAAELVMLKVYLDKAFEAWTHNAGEEPALSEIRKIAAIAMRAMENNGVTRRY